MATTTPTATATATEVKVPDIGEFDDVPIIEVHVSAGDRVNAEDPLVTLESDKATKDVLAPAAGSVAEVPMKVGNEVGEGTAILLLAPGDGAVSTPPSLVEQQEPEPDRSPLPVSRMDAAATGPAASPVHAAHVPEGMHAGPSVRRTARELGIDLSRITPSGPKGRITKDDLLAFLKGPVTPAAGPTAAAAGWGIPEIPAQDFSKFGPIETREPPRIKKVSRPFLHRSWLNVPHVTHNDEADITDLDRHRKELDTAAKNKRDPYRVTLLAFLIKASGAALKKFAEFTASLSPEKDALILKSYYNIGVAVDTPGGLVVRW